MPFPPALASLAPLEELLTAGQSQRGVLVLQPLAPLVRAAWQGLQRDAQLPLPALVSFVRTVALLLWQRSLALLPQSAAAASEQESAPMLDREKVRPLAPLWIRPAAERLAHRQAQGLRSYPRAVPPSPVPLALQLKGVTLQRLQEAYRRVLSRQGPPALSVARERFSLPRLVQRLIQLLSPGRPLSFHLMLERCQSRGEQVAWFLALLESAHRRQVEAYQEHLWGDILVALPGSRGAVQGPSPSL